jgi:hypothetical protein
MLDAPSCEFVGISWQKSKHTLLVAAQGLRESLQQIEMRGQNQREANVRERWLSQDLQAAKLELGPHERVTFVASHILSLDSTISSL